MEARFVHLHSTKNAARIDPWHGNLKSDIDPVEPCTVTTVYWVAIAITVEVDIAGGEANGVFRQPSADFWIIVTRPKSNELRVGVI
jgi:hypothetical protein